MCGGERVKEREVIKNNYKNTEAYFCPNSSFVQTIFDMRERERERDVRLRHKLDLKEANKVIY